MKMIKIRKQKWEYFSEQEIINILTNSKSYKEALLAFGYKATDSSMNYKIRELSEKFNVSLSHFTKTGTLIGQKFGMLQVIGESKKNVLYPEINIINASVNAQIILSLKYLLMI